MREKARLTRLKLQSPLTSVRKSRTSVTTARGITADWNRCVSQRVLIDASTDPTLDLHLVAHNYAMHKHPSVLRWLARHPRYPSSSAPHALHPDQSFVAQPGGALVSRAYTEADTTRIVSIGKSTSASHHRVRRAPQFSERRLLLDGKVIARRRCSMRFLIPRDNCPQVGAHRHWPSFPAIASQ